jgi:Leucine-rich repeat (LRR) protein
MMVENNIVKFEDKNLAKLVAEEICGQPNLDVLTEENLATITEIFAVVMLIPRPEEEKIRSLKGLEHCTNLRQLHLIDHNITDLSPLQDLSNLEVVVLRSNKISSIEALAGKETIRTLVVGQNELKDVSPAKSLTGLKQLLVQENPLEHKSLLFVNELPELRELCFWETNEAIIKEVGKYRENIRLYFDKEAA